MTSGFEPGSSRHSDLAGALFLASPCCSSALKLWDRTPLHTVDAGELESDATASLAARDFDLAGVGGTPVTAYVTRTELRARGKGTVAKVARPIPASMCVEKSLALGHLLDRLSTDEFVFVLDEDEVRFVVTRADLQTPAIGVVILAYLSAIEAGVRALVLRRRGDGWLDSFSDTRRDKVEKVFDQQRNRNVAIGMEDCLSFTDWMTILSDVDEARKQLGFTSRRSFEKATGSFGNLRNDLAHGRSLIDGTGPLRALARVARIRAFAELVWEELATVTDVWAAYAATVLELPRGRGVIAGPGAMERIPMGVAGHVITAWNRSSVKRSRDANRTANRELREVLIRNGAKPRIVIGRSPDGRWREERYLMGGLTRTRAAEIGAMFGQVAIFELDDACLRVVRCSDGSETHSVPRIVADRSEYVASADG